MAILVIISIMLVPLNAFAFGPLVHVDTGLEVLAYAASAAGAIFALIRRHRDAFLRGTLGPDREVAKNLVPYTRHTHNWNRAFALYNRASDDEERAFFLGYLCHLAADAVSHNYFVPSKVVEAHRVRFASHIYWEIRLDSKVGGKKAARTMMTLRINDKEHCRFLASVIPGNVLGPRINVRVTGIAMRLQRALAFRAASAYVDRESKIPFSKQDAEDVKKLAIEAQLALLKRLERAPIATLDPRGTKVMADARRMRRELRALRRSKPTHEAEAMVSRLRHDLRGRILTAINGQSADRMLRLTEVTSGVKRRRGR